MIMKQIFKYIFSLFLFFSFTSAVASESNWSLGEESQVRLISQKTHNDFKSEELLGKASKASAKDVAKAIAEEFESQFEDIKLAATTKK